MVVPEEKGYRIALVLYSEDLEQGLPLRLICERQYLPAKIAASNRPELLVGQDPNVWVPAQVSRLILTALPDIENVILTTCKVAESINMLEPVTDAVIAPTLLYSIMC